MSASHVRSVTADDIERAAAAISAYARQTPVLPATRLSRQTGGSIVLKAENLQATGSFKVRGALNRLAALSDEERAAGVLAASAGNPGQAVAWAARRPGTSGAVLMPKEAPLAKIAAVREYGAEVELTDGSFDESQKAARAAADADGRVLGD